MAEHPESSGPTPLDTTIRFFLSSTFADFQTERNVLQQRVFPELRTLCAESGFRLQPIDLRWGTPRHNFMHWRGSQFCQPLPCY